jgi:hypothetical protein
VSASWNLPILNRLNEILYGGESILCPPSFTAGSLSTIFSNVIFEIAFKLEEQFFCGFILLPTAEEQIYLLAIMLCPCNLMGDGHGKECPYVCK